MSFLITVIEFLQKQCSEDQAIEELLKNIDCLHRENIQIDKQLEESESERVRLQIELCNLDSTNSQYDKAAIENANLANMKVFEASVDLRHLLAKIDFEKILKCNYLEMEAKCRKECEPIQELMVTTAKRHEEMEQRYVVKRYRQAELALQEADDGYKNQHESMGKSLKESLELIENTTQRKNEIIVNLVKGSKDFAKLREEMNQLKQYEEHIELLNKQKNDLMKQLEVSQHKAFNFKPFVPYKSQDLSKTIQSLETSNVTMPKFPSFHDILNSFQMAGTKTEITLIENTTHIKSILHNSMELNQSTTTTTTKLTKKVHFKVPLEVHHEDVNIISEMETEDTNSDSSAKMIISDNDIIDEEDEENLDEPDDIVDSMSDTEIIDLLTPSEPKDPQLPQEVNDNESPNLQTITKEEPVNENTLCRPKIDIQECIVFKAPLPVSKDPRTIFQENLPSTSKDLKFSAVPDEHLETSNPLNEDFGKTSLSSNVSTSASPQTTVKTHSERSILKDFDSYLNYNREFLFSPKSDDTKEISKDFKQNKPNTDLDNKENETAEQEFMDFGSGNKVGFTFEASDDNMDGNFEGSDLYFMFR